jgi:hypothetical protein
MVRATSEERQPVRITITSRAHTSRMLMHTGRMAHIRVNLAYIPKNYYL